MPTAPTAGARPMTPRPSPATARMLLVLAAFACLCVTACTDDRAATTTTGTGTTGTGTTGATGTTGTDGFPGTTPSPVLTGRRVHVGVRSERTTWHVADAARVERHGETVDGIDLPVADVARDHWVWIDNTEHMEGIAEDSDGLTQNGPGCAAAQCIHVVVTPAGEVLLPNRQDRAVTELEFVFWSIHDVPAPTRDLPPDAPPLDEQGRRPGRPTGEPNLPVRIAVDPTPTPPSPTPTYPPVAPAGEARLPQAVVSLVARDGRHVQDIDPAGRGGFDLRPEQVSTPPGSYWVALRTYGGANRWMTSVDDDGADIATRGVLRHSALCEQDGCVRIELRADGSIHLADGALATSISFGLRLMTFPVVDMTALPPVDPQPAPTLDELAAPAGSLVVGLRIGVAGQADAPAVAGNGIELSSTEHRVLIDPYRYPDVSTFVLTEVPAGDYRLRVLDAPDRASLLFTDAAGEPLRYDGVGVHPNGQDPLVVTLYGAAPPPTPGLPPTTLG